MNFQSTDLARDTKILHRMDLDPEVYEVNDRIVVRWSHADDPWLEYVEAMRAPSDEINPGWQRDRPFWTLLDRADELGEAEFKRVWAAFVAAHSAVKDANRMVRLGLSRPTSYATDLKIWVEKLAEHGVDAKDWKS